MAEIPSVTVSELVAMSVKLGVDMTPHGDLEARLDAVPFMAKECQDSLEKLKSVIADYEKTI